MADHLWMHIISVLVFQIASMKRKYLFIYIYYFVHISFMVYVLKFICISHFSILK